MLDMTLETKRTRNYYSRLDTCWMQIHIYYETQRNYRKEIIEYIIKIITFRFVKWIEKKSFIMNTI